VPPTRDDDAVLAAPSDDDVVTPPAPHDVPEPHDEPVPHDEPASSADDAHVGPVEDPAPVEEPVEATAPVEEPVEAPGPSDAPATSPSTDGEPVDPDAELPTRDRLLRRLVGADALALDATPRARLNGWLWTLGVTVFAGLVRLWDLGRPHKLVFDETYYVKDGWSLIKRGYEAAWPSDPNAAFEAGDASGLGTAAEYVVHPQVGKWLIGLGIQLGGGVGSSAAWRLAAAVFGTLAVLLLVRIARRLFSSTAWGVVAGVLLAVDGEAIVMSRVSLLDPFLMFFVLAAFGALLLDREQARRRLADRAAVVLDAGGDLGVGPRLGWRWWRLAAAVLLGLAIGTKWSGLYFLAVFGLMTVAWDLTARRTVGVRSWFWAGIRRDGVVAGVAMVGLAAVTYVATWTSWLVHPLAYGRQWAADNPGQGVTWLPGPLRSLWKYHQDMWAFHTGLDTPHSYASHPLGWLVQWRPTSMFYPPEVSGLSGQQAQDACGASQCSQAITAIGNPVLWVCATAAILVAVVWLLRFRDWRAFAVLSGIIAGWLPWFLYPNRTIFTFYSVAFVPWMVLTLVYVFTLVVGPKDELDPRARRWAVGVVAAIVGLAVAVGAFFYPIWTGMVVPYGFWHAHMWLTTWI